MPPSEFASCPNCHSSNAKRVGYTWWGGALGPRLLTHVKCQTCGTTYNGNSGESNTMAIIFYMIATLAVALMLIAMLG